MRRLKRARLALAVAVALSLAIAVLELPISTLVHQRGAIAAASEHLRAVDAENHRLAADVAALRKDSTVAAMAHGEYGLVKPGQVEYVIPHLPGSRGTSGALPGGQVPAGDLVPPTASPVGDPAAGHRATGHSRGFWSQVLDRLAFWRGAF